MTWLQQLPGCDELKAFLRNSSICVIISKTDGSIVWTNRAFEEWSGYSGRELREMGWKQISVPGDALLDDEGKAQNWEEHTPQYTVQKQYYRKNRTACWGILTVMRFPPSGDVDFCICTWVPHEEASGPALDVALDAVQRAEESIRNIQKTVTSLTEVSTEQKFIMTAVQLAQKYPKVSWTILVIGFTLFGVNNVLEILKTVRIVPPVIEEQAKP